MIEMVDNYDNATQKVSHKVRKNNSVYFDNWRISKIFSVFVQLNER